MTVEEKAKQIQLAIVKESWNGGIELIAQALRDQIEECANVAYSCGLMGAGMTGETRQERKRRRQGYGYTVMAMQANGIAGEIRALAESPHLSPEKRVVIDRALDRLDGMEAGEERYHAR